MLELHSWFDTVEEPARRYSFTYFPISRLSEDLSCPQLASTLSMPLLAQYPQWSYSEEVSRFQEGTWWFFSRATSRHVVSCEIWSVIPVYLQIIILILITLGRKTQLEPYFSRVKFTKEQKRRWFRDREGLLFGFAVGFYIFLKIPLLGVLIYGIAEASTAYLITKITDPPPSPAQAEGFAESQTQWKNRVEFLKLPLDKIDAQNVLRIMEEHTPRIGKHDNVPTQQLQ